MCKEPVRLQPGRDVVSVPTKPARFRPDRFEVPVRESTRQYQYSDAFYELKGVLSGPDGAPG